MEIIHIVKAACDKNGTTFEVLITGDANHTDKNDTYLKLWKGLVEKEIGRTVMYQVSHGACDGRYFSAKSIPVLISRCEGSQPHIENEWVDSKGLETFKELVVKWTKKIHKNYLESTD